MGCKRWNWGLGLALALTVTGMSPARAEETPADTLYKTASQLVTQKKYAEALPALQQFLAQFPNDAQATTARLRLSDALAGLGRPEDAAKSYEAVLQARPPAETKAEALVGLARVRLAQKQTDAAVKALEEAIDLTEYDETLGPAVGLLLGDTLMGAGKYVPAAKAYERVTRWRLHPEAPRAYLAVGDAYRMAGSLADAAVAYRIVAEKYPRHPLAPRAALAAADTFLELKRLPEAEAAYRQVAQDYPESDEAPRGQLGLGRVELARGNLAAARAAFQAASLIYASKPAGAEAELRLADVTLAEGKTAEAERQYGALAASREGAVAAEARFRLASLRERAGQNGPAAELYRQLAEDPQAGSWGAQARTRLQELRAQGIDPAGAGPLLDRAEKLLASGQLQEAAGAFQEALDRGPEVAARTRARIGLAEAEALGRRPDRAEAQVRALAADGAAAGVLGHLHARLAAAYERVGEPDRALTAYRAALAAGLSEADAPDVLLGLAGLLSDRKKPEEAEPLLQRLFAEHPRSPRVPEALYALAWCALERSQPEVARSRFQRLLAEHPSHRLAADAAFRLGELAYDAGDFAGAAERYRTAAGSGSGVAEKAGYKLGWTLRRLNHPAEAAEAFLEVVKRAPSGELAAEARVRAGEALLALERDAEALRLFEQVATDAAAGAELQRQARVGAAAAELTLGHADRARALAEPEAQPAYGWYGARAALVRADAILLRDGPKSAAGEFQRVADQFARHPDLAAEAQFRAAECWQSAGNAAAARNAWQRVVDRFSGTPWAERSRAHLTAPPRSAPTPSASGPVRPAAPAGPNPGHPSPIRR